MSSVVLTLVAMLGAGIFWNFIRGRRSHLARDRLAALYQQENRLKHTQAPLQGSSNTEAGFMLSYLKDRLGRAGYITLAERRWARFCCAFMVIGTAAAAGLLQRQSSSLTIMFAALGGAYAGICIWLLYLRYRTMEIERQLLFELPLLLEAVVLLVEAGLGVLPALQRIVEGPGARESLSPLKRVFRIIYRMAASGIPFHQALHLVADAIEAKPLRHALIHLDISNSEGGELIPSLRSLSDHSQTEWRLSVEARVRRLENLVVFPVFSSVVGLLLLTASVPLVPVLRFFDSAGRSAVIGAPPAGLDFGQAGSARLGPIDINPDRN